MTSLERHLEPTSARVSSPSPQEVAAILAAIDAMWPRPSAVTATVEESNDWRFSGRWWSKPHAVQRSRPWVSPSS